MDRECTCGPCLTPAQGAPGLDHCAACCYGTLITDYDHDCPIPEHRDMAIRQWGSVPALGAEGGS